MTQAKSKSGKVIRTYPLALKCLNQAHRRQINLRIKDLENKQLNIINKKTLETAISFYRSNPWDRFPRSKISKAVGKSPNIAESAYHWMFIALKGKFDREEKLRELIRYWSKNPQQAIEWFILSRSPYTEHKFSDIWKVRYVWTLNFLTSTRRQLDSYLRKKFKSDYVQKHLKFNDYLPQVTYNEVRTAISDSYQTKNQEFAKFIKLSPKQITFLSKLHKLDKNKDSVASFLTSWINTNQKARWNSLKKVAAQIAETLGEKNLDFFSAVRLIVTYALFPYLWKTVNKVINQVKPEDIIPLPFGRKRKGNLPIILMMNKNYVITRPGNAKEMTYLAFKNGRFELGFPKRNHPKLTAQLIFPNKVIEYIKNGAEIKVLQIKSGKAPSYKPRINVIIEGESSNFLSNKLMNGYKNQIPSSQISTIGVDINRIGKHMVAFNVPSKVPNDLLLLSDKYYKLTNHQLKKLNSSLKTKGRNKDSLNYCKNKGELNRVHKRRNNILHEIKNRLSHFIAAVLVKNKCKIFCVENLQSNPRGKRGALARAIYNMPDEVSIFEKAVSIASKELGYNIELIRIDPKGTSTKHFGCGGKLQRNLGSYDYAPCEKCGQKVNTHINAAKNISEKGEKILLSTNFPSSHVRDTGTILSSDV